MQEIRFHIEEADVVAAQKLWFQTSVRWRRLAIVAAILIVAWLGAAIAGAGGDLSIVWPMVASIVLGAILFVVVLVVISYALFPRRARRLYRQHKAMRGEVALRWSATGIEITSALGDARLPWQIFHAWALDGATLILKQNDILFNLVPRRVLPAGAIEEIEAYLRAADVPQRGRFGFAPKNAPR